MLVAVAGVYRIGAALSRPVQAHIGLPPSRLNAECVSFPSQSGAIIHGWLSHGSRDGSVLLLPGVRANRLSMVGRAQFLRDLGYSVLLIDFQATGESAGDAITFGWRERFDVLASVEFLRHVVPGDRVAVLGSSLGGAAALLAAPPLRVDGAILEAVYPSIDRAVVNRLRIRVGALAEAAAPLLLLQLKPRLGSGRADLRPVDHVGQLQCPVLVIAGEADQHTTLADTQLLFAAAHQPKELWVVPQAGHVDYLEFAGTEYRSRVTKFLAQVLRQPTAK